MRLAFKLDENLGFRAQSLLLESGGYDVSSVLEQQLAGSSDDALIQVCRTEKRILVTLDLDFANPIHFPPTEYAGIVVLRPGSGPQYEHIIACLETFLGALTPETMLYGKLWIVSASQIREYLPAADE